MNRRPTTVAVMMPADMGGAVARMLADKGLRVVTNLDGRSARTRKLAAAAGVEEITGDGELVANCDAILSIVAPSGAVALAERLAPAIRAAGTAPLYLDCNAIAPATARAVNDIVTAAGARFVDAGIIGPPPRGHPGETRFYVSGPAAVEAAELLGVGIDMRPVSDRIGDASAVKMCYAALTKGTTAVMIQLLVAAERLGVLEPLAKEFAISQAGQLARMRQAVPESVPKAFRWVAEMEEIGRTLADVGITPRSLQGAADIYSAVAATALGNMRVEDWASEPRGFDEVVRRLAAEIQ
jgi:3-hydroxyisobutyrate dehydrogenase-like beta-hydroxyacid dehydrogenase